MTRFNFVRNPVVSEQDTSVEAFLRRLGGPTSFFIDGADTSRTRAFVTLLHGNEPSGVRALLRWLQSGQVPAVNVVCIVAAVETAVTQPVFTHRMLPGARDLNRCFKPPFEDGPGMLAQEILEILHLHQPECVVDMHNTSGSGPAFGVCTFDDRQHDALVSLFTRRLIVSNLGLGALMDISEHHYPTVTIEVGGREDEEAHALAYEGLCRYFLQADVLAPAGAGVELLCDPIRLELNEGVGLCYSDAARPDSPVTLRASIEKHNFGVVTPDTLLGWAAGPARELFRARDAQGNCAVKRLVEVRDGRLYPAQPLKLFMVTSDSVIARSDCLFYAVEDDGQPHWHAC